MTAFVLGYSIFMGSVIDMSNLWAHKILTEHAAQAACQAGMDDIYWVAQKDENYLVTNNYLLPGAAPDTEPPYLASFEAAPTGFQISNDNSDFNASVSGETIDGSCDSGNGSTVAMCAYAAADGFPLGVNGDAVTWQVSGNAPEYSTINPNSRLGIGPYMPVMNVPSTPTPVPYGILPNLNVEVSQQVHTYLIDLWPGFHRVMTISSVARAGLVFRNVTGRQYPTQPQSTSVNMSRACDMTATQLPTLPSISYVCNYRNLVAMEGTTDELSGSSLSDGTLHITCVNCDTTYFSGQIMVSLAYSCDGGSSYTDIEEPSITVPTGNPPSPITGITESCPSGQDMTLNLSVGGGGRGRATSGPGPSKESWVFSPPAQVLASFTGSTTSSSSSPSGPVTVTIPVYGVGDFGTN